MKIEDAIGIETFPQDLIRKGCTIHKKTLSERDRHQLTPVKQKKKLRSLKQRVGSVIIM